MGRQSTIVRVSSKGQIVIPVAFRRRLGLKTGQPLAVRAGAQDEIVLRPVDRDSDAVDEMRRRLRAAARKLGGDPLRELHARRRREREIEGRKHERWGHWRRNRHCLNPRSKAKPERAGRALRRLP